jgi:hypothetical protein
MYKLPTNLRACSPHRSAAWTKPAPPCKCGAFSLGASPGVAEESKALARGPVGGAARSQGGLAALCSPSPRLRGEGWGEVLPHAQNFRFSAYCEAAHRISGSTARPCFCSTILREGARPPWLCRPSPGDASNERLAAKRAASGHRNAAEWLRCGARAAAARPAPLDFSRAEDFPLRGHQVVPVNSSYSKRQREN